MNDEEPGTTDERVPFPRHEDGTPHGEFCTCEACYAYAQAKSAGQPVELPPLSPAELAELIRKRWGKNHQKTSIQRSLRKMTKAQRRAFTKKEQRRAARRFNHTTGRP